MPNSSEPIAPDPTHSAAIIGKGDRIEDLVPLLVELTESLAFLTATSEEAFMIACTNSDDPLKLFDQLAVRIQMRLLTKTVKNLAPQTNREYLERCSIAAGTILANIRSKLVEREQMTG